MHHFVVCNGELHAEETPLAGLARDYGTPLYVYSSRTLTDHWKRLDDALAPVDHLICYAMKANSNLAILAAFARLGSGFDVVSGGELFRVLKAGGSAGRCTFAGVGKTRAEIEFALEQGIYSFNVESEAELEFLNDIAGAAGRTAPVAIRVNPNVDAGTHTKITTGTYANKFGIAFEQVEGLYGRAAAMPHLRLRGLQTHIGSQITAIDPFVGAVRKLVPLAKRLRDRHGIEFFDIGGGIGIVYERALESGRPAWWKQPDRPITALAYAEALLPDLKKLGMRVLIEPGRFLVGNAGVLLARVLYVKQTGGKRFVIVDAAMNDLMRPALYDSYHEIVPVAQITAHADRDPTYVPTDVVGPICESGDVFCKDRPLPELRAGDLVAILSSGAYGFSMASNYNSRPRAAEVLVDGAGARVVRARETFEDLIRGESV